MAGYDASVKFESSQAEANIVRLANKMGSLRTKFSEAAKSASSLGGTLKTASGQVSEMNRRTNTLQSNVKSVGEAARIAATRVGSFTAAFRTAEMKAVASTLQSLSRDITKVAGSMKSMRGDTTAFNKQLDTLSRRAGVAATALGRLDAALRSTLPQMRAGTRALLALTAALSGGAGTYRIAVTGLNGVGQSASKAGNSVNGLTRSQQNGTKAAQQYGKANKDASHELFGLGVEAVRARNVLTFLATGLGVGEVIAAADGYKLLQSRLAVVSKTNDEVKSSYDQLLASSNKTRTGFEDNAKFFTRLSLAGEQYGITASEIIRITENVNKALIVSGATAGEAAAATQQLSQAFSSGRLAGDELKSVLENAPVLAVALTTELKDLGINAANLREKAKKGQIGIEELRKAFGGASFTAKMEEDFRRIPITVGQSLQVAKNNLLDFIGKADQASGVTKAFSSTIVFLSEHLDTIAGVIKVLAFVMGVRLVTSLTTAAGAALLDSAAFTTMAGSATLAAAAGNALALSGRGIMAIFGGPLGAALAVIGAGLYALYSDGVEAQNALDSLAVSGDNLSASLVQMENHLIAAGKKVDTLTMSTSAGDPLARSLATAYNIAADAARRLGENARFAAIMVAQGKIAELDTKAKSLAYAPMQVGTLQRFGGLFGIGPSAEERTAGLAEIDRQKAGYKQVVDTFVNMSDADFNKGNSGGGVVKSSVGGGGGGSKKGGSKGSGTKAAKQETDQLGEALKSLRGQISETDAKRQEFNDGFDTLNKSFKAGKINADEYKTLMGQLAANVFPGLKSQMDDLAKTNKELQWKVDGADDAEVMFKQAAEEAQKQLGVIDAINKAEGDKEGSLARQRGLILDQLAAYGQMVIANEQLTQQDKDRTERQRQITELIDDASNKMYSLLVDRVRDAMTLSGNLFKNFFKGLLGLARDTFASVIGTYVFAPLQQKFRGALEDAFKIKRTNNGVVGSQAAAKDAAKHKEDFGATISLLGGDGKKTSGVKNADGTTSITINADNDNGTTSGIDGTEGPAIVVSDRTNFFREIGNGYKDSFKDLKKTLKPVGKVLEGAAAKIGISSKAINAIGRGLGKAVAGAQVGMAVADFGKMIGIKTSKTGGAIGGAIGSLGGPIGTLVGSVLGSVIGGALKKVKKGSVNLSTGSFGNTSQTDAVGNAGSTKAAATALGGQFRSSLQGIADSLGVNLGSNVQLGSIGQRGKKFTFDPSGSGKTKGSGVLKFKTEEEAIRAAVANALRSGVLKGLSDTSNKVLQTFKDTDRALQLVGVLEDVKRRAISIRDPLTGSFKVLQKDFEKVTDMFREMGASAADYADLQVVIRDDFEKTLADLTSSLKAFRDDLIGGDTSFKSASDRLTLADANFQALEAKIASGEFIPQDQFTKAGGDLQSLAREVFGSTPEFALIQQRLIAATDKLINNAETEAEKYKPVVDAIAASAASQAQGTTVTNELLAQIAASLSGGGGGGLGSIPGLNNFTGFAVGNF